MRKQLISNNLYTWRKNINKKYIYIYQRYPKVPPHLEGLPFQKKASRPFHLISNLAEHLLLLPEGFLGWKNFVPNGSSKSTVSVASVQNEDPLSQSALIGLVYIVGFPLSQPPSQVSNMKIHYPKKCSWGTIFRCPNPPTALSDSSSPSSFGRMGRLWDCSSVEQDVWLYHMYIYTSKKAAKKFISQHVCARGSGTGFKNWSWAQMSEFAILGLLYSCKVFQPAFFSSTRRRLQKENRRCFSRTSATGKHPRVDSTCCFHLSAVTETESKLH